VRNSASAHRAEVSTDGAPRAVDVPAKTAGRGSAVNGGELLMLALATCYCNDLFREAARAGISLEEVEVEARGDFPGVGLAARDITYRVRIESSAPAAAIAALVAQTDAVAEVHNTLRAGTPVRLVR
jgi:organic hydroperoxide reductase OsmC/OhrA